MSRTYYCANCLNSFVQETDVCPNLACQTRKPRKGWGQLLGAGDTFDRRYHIIKMLAVGGAGITYLGRELGADDEPIDPDLAIKVLFHQRDSGPFLRRLANEAQILQDLNHPNIVECRGFVNRVGSEPYLLTLFERGGNLQEHIRRVGPVPPSVAAGILRQILYALDTGHRRGIIHRDLKPQNVLLRAQVTRNLIPHCLVADFGIAKVSGALADGLTQVGTFIGTPEYASPEQFTGEVPEPAGDVFAAGAVLYFTMTGKTPVTFSHRTDVGTSIRELLEGIPPVLPKSAGTEEEVGVLQEVLNNTMTANVKGRWAVRQILEHLQKLGRSDAWLLSDDPVEETPAPTDPLHSSTMVPGQQADDDEQHTFVMPLEPPPPTEPES
ncbi:MAG: serine/threonine protein kinase, partial [Proteobacteria bacterium]|nr:serine/threonine protein kinase [Pseudomonadota bacterium]